MTPSSVLKGVIMYIILLLIVDDRSLIVRSTWYNSFTISKYKNLDWHRKTKCDNRYNKMQHRTSRIHFCYKVKGIKHDDRCSYSSEHRYNCSNKWNKCRRY